MTSLYESQLNEIREQLNLCQKILDNVPALIYMNEFTRPNDPTSLRNIWSNKFAKDFIGYSQDEITKMGFNFFEEILHCDDLDLIKTINQVAPINPSGVFTFLHRLKPKGKKEYKWMYGNGIPFGEFEQGFPMRSLNVVIEISNQMNSENQLIMTLKEINRLRNELKCSKLTKREKEILGYIATGLTDSEIAEKLFISFATAKTHRNKIIKKLQLKNTACLAAFAVECGIC